MFLTFIAALIPSLSTLLAFCLAAFVLSRNRRAWANRWLAFGLLAIGVHQGIMLASGLVGPGQWRLALFRLALATAAVIPPGWLAFSLIFGEGNGSSRLARWRPALFGAAAFVPLAWIGLATGHVALPVRLGNTGIFVVGLDGWGKVY